MTGAIAGPATRFWSTPGVLAVIGVYLLTHYLLRLHFGGSLGYDDAEQALFAQTFRPSYRTIQPPFYTWLLVLTYEVLGVSLATTVLPRYLLLALTFVAMYLVARRWIGDRTCAALAVFSYALIYVFAYYAHHDLTHTTAIGAGIALTFLTLALIVEKPASNVRYLLLGPAMAIGLLGKWNFITLGLGLPIACLIHPAYRRFVLTPRVLLPVASMAVLLAPTGLWMVGAGATPAGVAGTVLLDPDGGARGPILLSGTLRLAGATLLFPMPFLVVFAAVFGRAAWRGRRLLRAAGPAEGRVGPDLLLLLVAVVVGIHWLLVPLAGADAFTARWMHPALMILPIPAFQLVAAGGTAARPVRIYLVIILIAVLLALGVRAARHLRGADHCGKCREMAPFTELAAQFRALGYDRGTIVADGYHVGGNMRVAFPESRVLDPASRREVFPSARGHGSCLAVWSSEPNEPDAGMLRVERYLHTHLGVPDGAPLARGGIGATMQGSSSRAYRLGYAYLAGGAGDCS